jgi:hypothetical protein
LLARGERALRHVEFEVERPQLEVRVRDLADEAGDDGSSPPLIGQELGARGFRGPPVLAPKIQVPDRGALKLDGCGGARRYRAEERRALAAERGGR